MMWLHDKVAGTGHTELALNSADPHLVKVKVVFKLTHTPMDLT